MKKMMACIALSTLCICAVAQKRYFTKTGNISFEAGTAIEDIDAVNKSASSILDASTGQIELAVLIKGFEFKRALMQEHFNENYMESDQYPKSTFRGKITNIEKVNMQKDGTYPVTVSGTLEIHGVKKEIDAPGQLSVAGGSVRGTATFSIALADFNIAIPSLVKDKISKTVQLKIDCNYQPLKQ